MFIISSTIQGRKSLKVNSLNYNTCLINKCICVKSKQLNLCTLCTEIFFNIFILSDIIIDIPYFSNTHRNCILLFFPLTTLLPALVTQAGLQVFFLLVVLGIWSFTTIFNYMYVISTSIISLWVKKSSRLCYPGVCIPVVHMLHVVVCHCFPNRFATHCTNRNKFSIIKRIESCVSG